MTRFGKAWLWFKSLFSGFVEPDMSVMYELFSEQTRKVMQLANDEAQRFDHEYIGTEHILLGLVKENTGVAAKVLKNLGLDLGKIRLEVERIVQAGPDMVTIGKRPQTPRAKKVIEYAIEEARNHKQNYVGTEHLLLGLLREKDGVGAQVLVNVLVNLGVKLEDVRLEILNVLANPSPPATEPDSLEKAIQKLPAEVKQSLEELVAQIKQLYLAKIAAVADQDFHRAALLRDQVNKIKQILRESTEG